MDKFNFGNKKQIEVDKKTGLNFRPNTLDFQMFKEMCEYEPIFENCKDQVVLDIGANIGVFTHNALQAGAKQVIAYEPEKRNFEVLESQPFDDRVILENKAVFNKVGTAEFYVSQDRPNRPVCMGRHSIVPILHRKKEIVQTVDFLAEIDKYKPTIIKCDIEGGEIYLDWEKLPNYVKYLAIEVHFLQKEKEADIILNWFNDNFTSLYSKDNNFFKKRDSSIRTGVRK